MLGKSEGRRRRGSTDNEIVGWHHPCDGHEFEQTPGSDDGQGSLNQGTKVSHALWQKHEKTEAIL